MFRVLPLVLTLVLLLMAGPAFAIPTCQPGTMADYLALSADGCFLPRSDPFFRVSGFTYVGFDPEPVPASEVDVLVGPISIAATNSRPLGWERVAFSFTIAGVNGIQIGRDVLAGGFTNPGTIPLSFDVNVLTVPGGLLTLSNSLQQQFLELPGVPEQRIDVVGFAAPGGITNVGLSFSPTPEPATLLLVGTGAAGVGLVRWVKRRRAREPDHAA